MITKLIVAPGQGGEIWIGEEQPKPVRNKVLMIRVNPDINSGFFLIEADQSNRGLAKISINTITNGMLVSKEELLKLAENIKFLAEDLER